MFVFKVKKKNIVTFLSFALLGACIACFLSKFVSAVAQKNTNFIKYAEFGPTYEALEKSMNEDIKS